MRILLSFAAVFFFTLSALSQSPGGISANNTMWLRSDVGITSASNLVTQWQEVSGAGVTGNFTVQSLTGTANVQTSPSLVDAGINFNPYIRFDGVTNSLSSTNLFPGTSLVTDNNVTVFQVFNLKGGIVWLKWETDQVGATGRIGFENASGNIRFDFPKAVTVSNGENVGTVNVLNQHALSTAYADVTIATSINRLNGANNNTLTLTGGAGNFAGVTDKIVIGNENLINLPAQIDIAEVIIYARTLTPAEINKVESYLAVKYGFTLDQAAANANDYTASDGTITWNRANNSGYAANITGIGRDDASNLAQKQSKSVNANGLITIYTNGVYTGGNFPLLNSTNANSFSNDRSFVLIGDNAASTAIDQCIFDGKGLRMQRVWKASVINTALPATFSADNGSIPATAKNIIVSPDPTFPTASTTMYPLTVANGKLYAQIPLNHNDYFTYATDTIAVTLAPTQPTCTNPNSGSVNTTVTGNASPLTYSWSPSGQATQNLSGVASGTYTLTVTQGSCAATYTVTLSAPGAPAAPIVNNVIVCSGNSATLSIQNPDATLTYNWYSASTGGTLLYTGTTYNTTISATTTFYVEAVTGSCSSPRTAVTATYDPMPQPQVNEPVICPNATAILTVQTPNANYVYTWYADAANTVVLATGTTYTTPAITANTDYYVVSTYAGCSFADTVTVTVNTVTAPVVNNVALCGTNVTTLSVQNPNSAYTYNWYTVATGGTAIATGTSYTTPALTSNTTYYIESVSGGCASVRTPATVNLGGATAPVLVDQTICNNLSTSIPVQNSLAGYTYNWYATATGGNILFTGDNFTTPPLNTATTYYVEAVNGGCTSVRVPVSISIDVVNDPVVNGVSVCSGSTAQLNIVNPGAGLLYNWYATASGGTPLATGATFTTGAITAQVNYYVGAADAICQSGLVPVTVNLIALDSVPVSVQNVSLNSVTFSWQPYAGTIGYQVSIDGGPFVTPSSGNLGTTHTINGLSQSQTVTIEVIALGPPQGCGDSYPGHATATTYGEGFYMPTAFTPNSGSLNNSIKPKLPGGAVLEYFTVFNRWGQRIFTTSNSGKGWDGTFQGKDQPVGTYVWICRYLHLGRIEVEQHGSFTLLR
ncbi:MAG: gliding motility-associated C-terminal domain-containing protein [Bacteroidetes bacterium]|nr:gliding motility-associated C-terminal domain-containing protein [Bacteroidota bacterium]